MQPQMGNNSSNNQIGSYNAFQTKGGNLIWAGALSLAWHELVNSIIKENVKIVSNDPLAKKLVHNFNTCQFTRKDIDQMCIYVKSGYGQDTVNKINAQCKKKFPQKSFGDISANLQPRDIISYAYLLKKLQFTTKFQKKPNNTFLFEGKKVPSFYAQNQQQKKQIRYYQYKSNDEFLISVDAKNPNDQIFFIKNMRIKSIEDAIKLVVDQNQNKGQVADQDDLFQMPIVDLDVSRNVKEIEGQAVANKKFTDYEFSIVYEAIKLKIDQAGAKVQNQGMIMTLECCMMKMEEPKRFILDKQFWVVMKEEGKHPYFCGLIKSPEDK